MAIANEVATAISGPIVAATDVVVDDAFLGAGYGAPSIAGTAAIELLARTEGVLADPVYSGKALAGLLAAVRSSAFSPGEAVVFVHTGGAPAHFADLAMPV
jgi:1-aminocyclopropane-1-carboxylate deaminase/D-cysteine desulfhydrase-like pyridoxal-dependent ACC family enzyme